METIQEQEYKNLVMKLLGAVSLNIRRKRKKKGITEKSSLSALRTAGIVCFSQPLAI